MPTHTDTFSTAGKGWCSTLASQWQAENSRQLVKEKKRCTSIFGMWCTIPEAEIRRETESCESRKADVGNFKKSSWAHLVVRYPVIFRIPNKVLHLLMNVLMTLSFTQWRPIHKTFMFHYAGFPLSLGGDSFSPERGQEWEWIKVFLKLGCWITLPAQSQGGLKRRMDFGSRQTQS